MQIDFGDIAQIQDIGGFNYQTAVRRNRQGRGLRGIGILSQVFRGFSKSITQKETLSAADLATALQGGVETAYKAVMKPQEGTILTVARKAAEAAKKTAAQTTDIVEVMKATYEAADAALQTTPDLLPVLKEVGVVDSGGQGLTFVDRKSVV